MKVLFAAAAPPWPLVSGGALRSWHLLRGVRGAAQVCLRAAARPGVDEREARAALEQVCDEALILPRSPAGALAGLVRARRERWFHSQALRQRLAQDLATGGFDLLHLDEGCLLSLLPEGGPPLVAHHHKLDLELARACGGGLRGQLDALRTRRLERALARRAALHVVCCPEDARRLLARHPRAAAAVVPNGVDPQALGAAAPHAERDARRVLFLGSLDYAPNRDGLGWYLREIHPLLRARRPQLRLQVVGSGAPQGLPGLDGAGVEFVGAVPDVRPHLACAALLVAPLRIGGGTRLKLLEALALACPVVATPVAAEGLELVHGEHLLLAATPGAFAAAVEQLLADRARAARLAQSGCARVRSSATWAQAGAALLAAWERARASAALPAGAARV